MPYTVKKEGPRNYAIVRADTGKVVGHSTSRHKAEASIRARLAGEHGGLKKSIAPAMSAVDASAGGAFVGPPSSGPQFHVVRNRPTIVSRKLKRRGASAIQGKSLDDPLDLSDILAILEARDSAYKLDKDLHGPHTYVADAVAAGDTQFDDKTMAITFPFAASHGRDRIGDFLEVSGIWTVNHERNPVSYLDHGKWCKWPIGKTQDPDGNYTVTIDDEAGLAVCTTFLSQSLREAVQAYHLFRDKVLKCGSIGYRPRKAKRLPPDPSVLLPAGLHLIETELIETTLTGMPMNGDCARKAMDMRVDGSPLAEALRRMIEPFADPKKAWANGANLTQGSTATMKTKKNKAIPANGDPNAALGAAPAAGQEPPPDTAPDEEAIKHGAQYLADLHEILNLAHEHHEREGAKLDNEAIVKFAEKLIPQIEKLQADINECFEKEYPDLEPLEEAEDEDEDEEEEEEELDEGEGKVLPHRVLKRKSLTGATGKRSPCHGKALNKDEREVVGRAADFLDGHKDEDNLSHDQKVLVGHHAEQLKSLAGGGEDDDMSPEAKALVLSELGRMRQKQQSQLAQLKRMGLVQ